MNLREKFEIYCNVTNGKASMDLKRWEESGLTSNDFTFFNDNFDYLKYLFVCEMGIKKTVGTVACEKLENRIRKRGL